jgi:DNA-binding NarL/FixJ family response regulator
MGKISVFLADWQVLFREGIHFTLSGEEEFEVIGEATSSEDALGFIQTNPPRVAVLNTDHKEIDGGIKASRFIKRNLPSVAIILIMDSYDEEQLLSVMKSGASACLTKDAEPEDLIDTIRTVSQGNQPISESLLRPEIALRVLGEFEDFALMSQQLDNLLATLTTREAEILQQIGQKNSIEQICQSLNISEEYISQSFGFIMNKLVLNDYIREAIEAAHKDLLSSIFRGRVSGKPPTDYVTRGEFDAFKESLLERFQSVIGEIKEQ